VTRQLDLGHVNSLNDTTKVLKIMRKKGPDDANTDAKKQAQDANKGANKLQRCFNNYNLSF
jgi:hypothetical protein